MKLSEHAQLSYCTNIHAGESLQQVQANLQQFSLRVKQAFSPKQPFGLGLRLSAQAVEELGEAQVMAAFKAFLHAHQLYVFTVNGFPYGQFGADRVKETVYLPDWQDPKRWRYTQRLAQVLAALMPEDLPYGTLSTLPGGYKPAITDDAAFAQTFAHHLIDIVGDLIQLKLNTHKTIALGLEPEPCCFLETIEEVCTFFQTHVHSAANIARLAQKTQLSTAEAHQRVREHLGICLDFCHAAVEFESAEACVQQLQQADISIVKAQISAGIILDPSDAQAMHDLNRFDEGRYLHQVVERSESGFRRYSDIPEARRKSNPATPREWRVHFHVPIYRPHILSLQTTQAFVKRMLAIQRQTPFTQHLEVETYTWDVLPQPGKQGLSLCDNIVRELVWSQDHLR